jgi:hypothetical protein
MRLAVFSRPNEPPPHPRARRTPAQPPANPASRSRRDHFKRQKDARTIGSRSNRDRIAASLRHRNPARLRALRRLPSSPVASSSPAGLARQAGGHWFEPSTAHRIDKPLELDPRPREGPLSCRMSEPCQIRLRLPAKPARRKHGEGGRARRPIE